MLDLSHQALLTFLETNACDSEHPVVMDQVFGAELKRQENRRTINKLKSKIRKLKNSLHDGPVPFDIGNLRKLQRLIHAELFDQFTWSRVTTNLQASWKSYFHLLYDLVVDVPRNAILARTLVKYHDTLVEPEKVPYNDILYPIISSVQTLFNILKNEHHILYTSLKNIKGTVRSIQQQYEKEQHELLALVRTLKELERDNEKYLIILQWSVRR
jgi:hypothetical protein